ncbi:MAG: hypothetical protein RLZZ262_2224 [Bacteroidota bacterium]|jgi:hypothetical protein
MQQVYNVYVAYKSLNNFMKITLRGLAEGIVGASNIDTVSVEALFKTYPELNKVQHKLVVSEDRITGFAACDG